MMEFPLTPQQQSVFNIIEQTSNNVILMGKPGTGKSVVTRALLSDGLKHYTPAAPTGLAARNIDGKTLHSLFGIPINGVLFTDYNNFTQNERVINYIKHAVKHLIIDEISMVRADIFDFINRMLKEVKGNSLPFGGIQVICVGDFYQLSPVVVGIDKKYLSDAGYSSPFMFDSFAFHEGDFKVLELTKVLRQQGDNKFIKLLDSARIGQVSATEIATLNKQVGKIDDFRIRVTMVNKDADIVNATELKKIDSPLHSFTATKYGEWPEVPCPELLQIKIGAQVVVKKNGADKPPGERKHVSVVVNGTLGKVVDICTKPYTAPIANEDVVPFTPHVIIELEDGTTAKIYRQYWEKSIKEKVGDHYEERVVATYDQFPLQLAWAISAHKSQGQSFSKIHIDANSVFIAGQMYVALSRARSLDGVQLERPITSKVFWADKRVLRFHERITETI